MADQELPEWQKQDDIQQDHGFRAVYHLTKYLSERDPVSADLQEARAHINAVNNTEFTFNLEAPKVDPVRAFGVWNGVSIAHRTMNDLFQAVRDLWEPYKDQFDQVEWYPKAGEGGSWQARYLHPTWGDSSSLAIDGIARIRDMQDIGKAYRIPVIPYVVIRGRNEWNEQEWTQIAQIGRACGRVILNLEPGVEYWNGPTDVQGVSRWWDNLRARTGDAVLEVACIPRASVARAFGGTNVMAEWIRRADRFTWECYDAIASDLGPESLKLVKDWYPDAGPEKLIPIVQRNRIRAWSGLPQSGYGMQVWHLDGNI